MPTVLFTDIHFLALIEEKLTFQSWAAGELGFIYISEIILTL